MQSLQGLFSTDSSLMESPAVIVLLFLPLVTPDNKMLLDTDRDALLPFNNVP